MSFHAVAALVIFCAVVLVTVVLVLVPVTIQLPAAWHQHLPFKSVSISYAGVPVAGTLLMLMTGVLDGQSFASGIVGDEHLKPYGIVILFMALAYMSSCKHAITRAVGFGMSALQYSCCSAQALGEH
jgi:hypothetical protein